MSTNGNKHDGNGRSPDHGGETAALDEPRFIEDETGTTINSGAATCRFEAANGGRISAWQWHTLPPRAASHPNERHQARTLELVEPTHGALIDHFLPLGTRPGEFAAGTHREFGDFVDGAYRSQAVDSGGEIRIGLLRDGSITAGKRVAEVRMAKSAAMRPSAPDVAVLYRIINSSLRPLQILFAVEFNLLVPGLSGDADQSKGYYIIDGTAPEDSAVGSSGVSPGATHLALANPGEEVALQLGWDRECDLWRMPASEEGHGARLLAVWRIQLPPRDNWAMGLWLAPS